MARTSGAKEELVRKGLCVALLAALLTLAMLPAAALGEVTYSAWLPYWELDEAMDEAESLSGELETLIAFAAILDENDHPFLLDETETLLLAMQRSFGKERVLLSVVNDVQVAQGEYINKTTDPLRRLFADEQAMNQHIARLLTLVDTYGLAGLEIDYENLKDDTELWAQYAAFIQKLYEQMRAEGLALRVVLSWDTPRYVTLPEGPEYVVMCYNLYGYHSGPGPKADFAFLDETAQLYANVPGDVSMAFATGGFEWVNDSVVSALTQTQAEELLEAQGVTPRRDVDSGALYAQFEQEGEIHIVWYADGETLARWCSHMQEKGFESFDFFRLGGNVLSDWEKNVLHPSSDVAAEAHTEGTPSEAASEG